MPFTLWQVPAGAVESGQGGTVCECVGLYLDLFGTIIFSMPIIRPVTAQNMNYDIVDLAGILAFAALHWFKGGRKFYTGPVVEADINEDPSRGGRSSDDELMKNEEMRSQSGDKGHAVVTK